MNTPFDQAIDELQIPVRPDVRQTLSLIYHLMEGDPESWQGSCHSLTAISYILLTEQGIEAVPCWGDVVRYEGPFDHGWLEEDGKVHDIAIAHPNQPHLRLPPVVAGRSLSDGSPPPLVYGTSPSTYGGHFVPNDPDEERLKRGSLTLYFDGAERHGLDLWFFVLELGKVLGLTLNRLALRQKYAKTHWAIRDQNPVPPEMLAGWRKVRVLY